MWRLLLGTMGVKSLVQGLNAAATAGFEPRTVWSEVRRRNRLATAPPLFWFLFLRNKGGKTMKRTKEEGERMVRWCIRLWRATIFCEMTRNFLVQVRQSLSVCRRCLYFSWHRLFLNISVVFLTGLFPNAWFRRHSSRPTRVFLSLIHWMQCGYSPTEMCVTHSCASVPAATKVRLSLLFTKWRFPLMILFHTKAVLWCWMMRVMLAFASLVCIPCPIVGLSYCTMQVLKSARPTSSQFPKAP